MFEEKVNMNKCRSKIQVKCKDREEG